MRESRYWIGVVSQDHVANAVAHGFVQLNHGKATPLERMQPGDGFAFYSPRDSYPEGAILQAFTAIGRVAKGDDLRGERCPSTAPSSGAPSHISTRRRRRSGR